MSSVRRVEDHTKPVKSDRVAHAIAQTQEHLLGLAGALGTV